MSQGAYKLACPHCLGRMRIRTSVGEHIMMRRTYLQCMNEACGWTGTATFEITHELSPSAMPNKQVQLPLAPVAIRRLAVQQPDDSQLDLLVDMEDEHERLQ